MSSSSHELESILQSLREGTLESRGSFTLEASRAREMLRQYQLADPYSYVLVLVAWAVAAGASTIEVGLSPAGLALVHDGQTLSGDDLRELFSCLFVDGGNRSRQFLRQLGIAVNAALNLPTRSLIVRSWRDGQGWEARYDCGEPQLMRIEGKPGSLTSLELRAGPGSPGRMAREEELLTQQCAWCPADLVINQRVVSQPVNLGACVAQRYLPSQLQESGVALRVEFEPASLVFTEHHPAGFSALIGLGCAPGPELTLVVMGRNFVRELPWAVPGWGLRLVVASDRVRLDLTQSTLVEDQVYTNLLKALWNQVLRLLTALAEGCQALSAGGLRQALPCLDYLVDSECAAGAFGSASEICAKMAGAWVDESDPIHHAAFCHKYSLIALKAGQPGLCGRLEARARELWGRAQPTREFRLPDGELLETSSYHRWLRLRAIESVLGPAHPGLVSELEACVRDTQARRRYRETVIFLRWLIRVESELHGPENVRLLERWLTLAGSLPQVGGWEEAREAYRRALLLCPRSRVRDLLGILEGLAQVEAHRGDLAEAVDLLERCLALYVELEGQQSPRLCPVLLRLAELLSIQGSGERATELRAWASHLPQRYL